jgi:hypothetical protein
MPAAVLMAVPFPVLRPVPAPEGKILALAQVERTPAPVPVERSQAPAQGERIPGLVPEGKIPVLAQGGRIQAPVPGTEAAGQYNNPASFSLPCKSDIAYAKNLKKVT